MAYGRISGMGQRRGNITCHWAGHRSSLVSFHRSGTYQTPASTKANGRASGEVAIWNFAKNPAETTRSDGLFQCFVLTHFVVCLFVAISAVCIALTMPVMRWH
jgi:hypothetical protein